MAHSESLPNAHTPDRIVLLECNIDDMTGEALGYALETILAAGALDAWFTPIYMKKNRPGTLLSVLCAEERGDEMRLLVLRETTTLGVRWRTMDRQIAERRSAGVETPYGPVAVKVKIVDGRALSAKPEYEDCAALARRSGVPLEDVLAAARAAAARLLDRGDVASSGEVNGRGAGAERR